MSTPPPSPPTCRCLCLLPSNLGSRLGGLGQRLQGVTWGDSESGLEKAVHFLPVLEEACSRAFSTVGGVWLCGGLTETPLFFGAGCCL